MINSDLSFKAKLYKEMLRIRLVEEKLIELFNTGEVTSPIHLSIGQEAVAVGVCQALRKQDLIVSTHRCHAHYLAKGGSLQKMTAELSGKVSGCSKGRGGSMLLSDPSVGMVLSSALVAGSIPIGVGLAWANKLKKKDSVVAVFFGDGAVEEGVFWESLNFASVYKLPVIFICENNLYATHSHILKRQPKNNIFERVKPFDVHSKKVNGNDVMEVWRVAKEMVQYSKNIGPTFIEARTYRWKEHWGPDEDSGLGYRSREEIEEWKERCPIKKIWRKLEKAKFSGFGAINLDILEEISDAVLFAKDSLEPHVSDLLQEEGYDA